MTEFGSTEKASTVGDVVSGAENDSERSLLPSLDSEIAPFASVTTLIVCGLLSDGHVMSQ